jgi:hypothetical protein
VARFRGRAKHWQPSSRPEIRLLNSFEAFGIAVNQGVLDPTIVGRLKEHGGWTDTQMSDRIYADQEAEVRS